MGNNSIIGDGSCYDDVVRAIKIYKQAIHNAPMKRGRVFNQQVPSKMDARYAFTSKLRDLAELCVLCRDKSTLALIQMSITSDEDAHQDNKDAIGKMKID